MSQSTLQVIKRDGSREYVDLQKILRAISRCAEGIPEVDPQRVAVTTIGGIQDGITTLELDQRSIATAVSLIPESRQYSKLASVMLTEVIRKEVVSQGILSFSQSVASGLALGLINSKTATFVEQNSRKFDMAIQDAFNERFEYFGLRNFYDHYLLRHPETGKVIETAQYLFFRVAASRTKTAKAAISAYKELASSDLAAAAKDWHLDGTTRAGISIDSSETDMVVPYRPLKPGMGQAVAERTILRKDAEGNWETWGDVANRVALGNSLLASTPDHPSVSEYNILRRHIANMNTLMSGRHLQHGDAEQPNRPQEVFTNCATSATSFASFLFLLQGSGIGRSYDDDMMLVNWDYAPNIRCVLDVSHPDFNWDTHECLRDAKHKYGTGSNVTWFTVPDSREGWAKALEMWEVAAYEKTQVNSLFIFDFSQVRPKGQPIGGMQGRPASGPVPLMNAMLKAASLKGAGLPVWKQNIYVDHYFAECVLVGGARRSARMSTKRWSDKTVLDFITVKRPIEYQGLTPEEVTEARKASSKFGFLWSSNNSVMADEEFWGYLEKNDTESEMGKHAHKVFDLICDCAYADGTGEPGIINAHKLVQKNDGWSELMSGEFIGSKKYQLNDETHVLMNNLAKKAKRKRHNMIVNPCVPADTWIQTGDGPRQVADLIDKPFTAILDGKPYNSTGFWLTGNKKVFEISTHRGYKVRATAEHKFLVETGRGVGDCYIDAEWRAVSNLKPGDKLVLQNHSSELMEWGDDRAEEFDSGWLLGEIVGDGGHNPESYATYLRFWGPNKTEMATRAFNIMIDLPFAKPRPVPLDGIRSVNEASDSITVSSRVLDDFADKYIEPITKAIKPELEKASSRFVSGFLRGFFDADGSVQGSSKTGFSVRLGQSDITKLQVVQRCLHRFGIASKIYESRRAGAYRPMPDGKGGLKEYYCKDQHELLISCDNINGFFEYVGFSEPHKIAALDATVLNRVNDVRKDRFLTKVESIVEVGVEPVYDCTVDEVHCFDANGFIAHNCSEVSLSLLGGVCVIADVVPFHCSTLDEAEDCVRAVTRALIRVNLMDCLYRKEVQRTNRIGVGITGVHEFAWKFFGFGFRDLIDEEKSKAFWLTLARFNRAIWDEAKSYSKELGVKVPHTAICVKPSGSVSKLAGLTEGWHLPAMAYYLRWVQFRSDDPLVAQYKNNNYPTRELQTYTGTTIVGFPTAPTITELGLGDKLVTAPEATPEEQYRWLMLGEKYWIHGTDENGVPVRDNYGNSISYSLKYFPDSVDLAHFKAMILKYQPQVRCCSVMPQEKQSSYEYLPEEPITREEYQHIKAQLEQSLLKKAYVPEDISREHIDCSTGACPVDFRERAA